MVRRHFRSGLEHLLLEPETRGDSGSLTATGLPLSYIATSGAGGLSAGAAARLLQLYGSRGLILVGAGLALWLTLTFVAGRLGGSARWSVIGSLLFLSAWIVGYYVTDAVQLGVPVATMWPVAKPWVTLVIPVSCVIGIIANRSTRAGVKGDAALALPLAWSIPEGALAVHVEAPWPAFIATLVIVGSAVALIAAERHGRPVNLRIALTAAAFLALPYTLVAVAVYDSASPL